MATTALSEAVKNFQGQSQLSQPLTQIQPGMTLLALLQEICDRLDALEEAP